MSLGWGEPGPCVGETWQVRKEEVTSEGSTLAMGRAQTVNLEAGAQLPSPSLSACWGT